jgi:two-component system, chemotaxis family, protein-glutamate methylesterase/glutaminase
VKRIRVLVVDDSVVVRRVVSDMLATDPEVEVVGTASNGRLALARLDQLNPDVVTMDVEMPEMDGLTTLRELRKTRPRLPVIMFSTLTERGASATLDALALGANDYVTKPSGMSSTDAAGRWLLDQLLPRVKALGSREQSKAARPMQSAQPRAAAPVTARQSSGSQHVSVVTIGVSTGGPQALAKIMPELPADFPVPILIVQHMPPLFTRLLADRLRNASRIRVCEAQPGMVVEPGVAYIAPGDWHMEVGRERGTVSLTTHQGPLENSCRPAADVLFRSVVETYGAGTLGVVLTGMGQDGLRGCERIIEAGGRVIAQDRETSVVWGMPGFVANANLAERIVPLSEMAAEITRRVRGVTTALRAPRAGVAGES